MECAIIMAGVVIAVYFAAHAKITINICRKSDTLLENSVTEADLNKAYEEESKDDMADFMNVIQEINKDFGGVNYGE